jgi:hypothetical protein
MRVIERRPSEIVGFLGARGTGKTSLMREVIRATAHSDMRLRFLIYDYGNQFVTGRYGDHGEYRPEIGTLSKRMVIYPDLETAKQYIERDLLQYQLLVFTPRADPNYGLQVVEFATQVCGIILVLDEIDQYSQKMILPDSLQRILNVGRHMESDNWIANKQRGISLFWAARRLQKVHNDFLSASSDSVMFLTRTVADTDISRLTQEFGQPLNRLKKLKNGQFLRLDGSEVKHQTLIVKGLTPYNHKQSYESDVHHEE